MKETKEVLVSLNELALIVAKHAKDGLQISDVNAVVSDCIASNEFKKAMSAAVENIAQVPTEIKNRTIGDIIEIILVEADYISKIISIFTKKD